MSRRVALALALALVGCRSRTRRPVDAAVDAAPPPPRATTALLDSVAVELHGRVERVIDSRALGRGLARCLIESGAPVAALAEQVAVGEVARHLALTVVVTAHEPGPEQPSLGVTLDAAGRWPDAPEAPPPAVSLTGLATPRPASGGVDPADAAAAAVVIELEPRLCAELAGRLTLWAADDLRPGLTSGDPGVVRWTLELASQRAPLVDPVDRLALVAAIAPHLGDEPTVRDAAITAMAATGDAHGVAPLAAITMLDDEPTLLRIIAAVARLGGDDARDYLQVMVSHRDPTVSEAARVGLASLALAPDAPP